MVMQSSQISGMVGGQMAMFSNQGQFSQQIGGMVGTSPQMSGGGMQNPFPSASAMVGGAAMALPGMATGASIAGGLMGGKAGWLDPFTGVARGFARGAGMGGAGAMSTLGGIGSAFAQGGARAGMGMIAGGLGGAALMAAPYMAAGAAINTVAGNVYQGAQNISEVGGMAAQHFGSQMGSPGSRGGQMGRGQVKQVVGVLRELMGDDVSATMGDLKKLMDQAGSQGMLSGIGDAQQFKQRFGKIVKQVRALADVMGSSLSEAGDMMQGMRQMGLWTTGDIMGTGVASQMAGGAAPQMMQSMQRGAQISHARGGSLRAGAMMGQRAFGTIQAAQQSGVLSQEDIMEFTGGVGGAEGQRMMAGRMTDIMSRFGQTSAGRAAMAGLGQTEEGRFTGKIDPRKLQQFQSGQIGLKELQRMGHSATRSRGGATSFTRRQGQLSQNLASEGGIEALTQLTDEIAGEGFGGDEDARALLMQQMLGVSAREAEMLTKLKDELPQIRDRQSRAKRDAINNAFQKLDERQNRSWQALKDAVGRRWDETVAPLQEFGEAAATAMGESMDDISDAITGRTGRIPMGQQERQSLLRGGALTATAEQAGISNEGQAFISGGILSNPIQNLRGGPSRAQAMMNAGVRLGGGEVQLGGGFTTSATAMQEAKNRAMRRAGGASMKRLKKDPSNPKKAAAMEQVKKALRAMIADPDQSEELRKLKEDDPASYAKVLTEKLGAKVPGAFIALREGGGFMDDLDTTAIAQEEAGYGGGAHAADFTEAARSMGMVSLGTMEEVAVAQSDAVKAMQEAAGGGSFAEAVAAGAGMGARAAGGGLLGAAGGVLGGIVGGLANIFTTSDVSRGDVESVMTGPNASLMQKFLSGEMSQEQMSDEVEKRTGSAGGEALSRVFQSIRRDPTKFKEAATKFGKGREYQAGIEGRRDVQRAAGANVTAEAAGLTGEAAQKFKDIRTRLAAEGGTLGDKDVTLAKEDLAELAAMAGKDKDLRGLLEKGGAIGRQASALSRAEDVDVMDPKTTAAFLKTIAKKTGYDLKKVGGPELEKLLAGGVEKGEVGDIKNLMAKAIKNQMMIAAEGQKDINQSMLQELQLYTSKNKEFVQAVDQALGGSELSEASKALTEKSKQGQGGSWWDKLTG